MNLLIAFVFFILKEEKINMNLKTIALLCFALSGMAALLYEVAWARPLQMIMVSTVYTASILFSFYARACIGLSANIKIF